MATECTHINHNSELMLMTHKKFHSTVVSTIGLVLAVGGLLSGVNAAPGNKQADTLKQPEQPGDAMKKPGDAMKKPGDAMKKPGDAMKKPGDAMKKPDDAMKKPVTPAAKKGVTIVELAVNSKKNFKTLTAALKASGLVTTLAGEGPFTLFAPNDAAFDKLPKGTLKKLLKPENKAALQQVLKNHVLSGIVLSSDIKTGNVTTLEGGEVAINVTGKKVTVGKANVLRTDIKASNGVVHIIDTVLVPADLKLK
jgi:pentapeptide MXKDX repeat protein